MRCAPSLDWKRRQKGEERGEPIKRGKSTHTYQTRVSISGILELQRHITLAGAKPHIAKHDALKRLAEIGGGLGHRNGVRTTSGLCSEQSIPVGTRHRIRLTGGLQADRNTTGPSVHLTVYCRSRGSLQCTHNQSGLLRDYELPAAGPCCCPKSSRRRVLS